jgi:Domain of unknown function DUF29
MSLPRNAHGYDEDFAAWLEDQAGHARRGEVKSLDLQNIAEELEGLARSDRREIKNRLAILLVHLLKHMVQSKRRSRNWDETISDQRQAIHSIIDDSPSLREFPASILESCYDRARGYAARETRLPVKAFPEQCPFTIDEVLDPEWLP